MKHRAGRAKTGDGRRATGTRSGADTRHPAHGTHHKTGDGRWEAGVAFDVVGFGVNTIDHVCVLRRPAGVDVKERMRTYIQQPGGQVPTALVALQRWGVRTAYVGPFGDDSGGALQRASLESEGVNIESCPQRTAVGSQVSIILVDEVTGERTVLWQRPAGLTLRPGELDRERLTSGRILLMDAADAETALCAATWAKASGVTVVLDVDEPSPQLRELFALSDAVVVSGDFPQRLTGVTALRPALRRMLEMGPALVAATLGAGGALACTQGGDHYQAAFPVAVIDSTSAGDLFHAGCVYGLLQAWPVARTLRFAGAAAALECTALGGRAAIPSLDHIRTLAF